MKVLIIQRILAEYRGPFFDLLAQEPGLEISVFAGQPMPDEGIKVRDTLGVARLHTAFNRYVPIPSGYVYWQKGIIQCLEELNPDLLIIAADPRCLSNRVAMRWMKRRRKPVICWGLGFLPRSGPKWLAKLRDRVAKRYVRKFDGAITYSSKAKQDYAIAGIPEAKITVAQNAIDNTESERFMEKLQPIDSWIGEWKQTTGLKNNLPVILFVGRLLPQKKVNILIDACEKFAGHAQLLIVGDGPSLEELRTYCQTKTLHTCFTGHQTGEALAKCFLGSDFFVLPGWGGLAVYQAMSYGKPIIVSFGDGTEKDMVREGYNGLLFDSGDPVQLQDKIQYLLDRPETRENMGNNSLSIIREEMSLKAMVDSFRHAIDSSLKRDESVTV